MDLEKICIWKFNEINHIDVSSEVIHPSMLKCAFCLGYN